MNTWQRSLWMLGLLALLGGCDESTSAQPSTSSGSNWLSCEEELCDDLNGTCGDEQQCVDSTGTPIADCDQQTCDACYAVDESVASQRDCLLDDAACYQLSDGSWCTGGRSLGSGSTMPDGGSTQPPSEVDSGTQTPDAGGDDACGACLASGGTWQPEASMCTTDCDILDISCFRDTCPGECADDCGACFSQGECEAEGCTWRQEAEAMWCTD